MTGFSDKPILIDGKGHLLGRLASVIAKAALNGNRVVVVRAEQINISGNFFRSKLKYLSFLRKRCNINPARGPFHFRAPSKILYRTIRGMVPHKIERGKAALRRIKLYEGCPSPYDKRKRMVVPSAMRVLCLKPGRAYCHLGRLSHEVGWKYKDVVRALETKRKVRAVFDIRRRKGLKELTKAAGKKVSKATAPYTAVVNSYGYR
ncbi:60S ribosomal protein L13a [Cimex lectularius]|uniref:Large ribosomal subunit protein uL13 n=1 Tax=Cimex lectularius TaxID=79782 RepID=A0A8I6RTW3_CIMLE|nr:60S ribosomal protein L13a [Cimex lectularius]